MKLIIPLVLIFGIRSLPLWECGLKSIKLVCCDVACIVTPLVGVWIEICNSSGTIDDVVVTPLVGVWIEIVYGDDKR